MRLAPRPDGGQPTGVFLKKRPIGEPVYLFTSPGKVPFPGTDDGRIGTTRQEALAWMTGAATAYQQTDQKRSTP